MLIFIKYFGAEHSNGFFCGRCNITFHKLCIIISRKRVSQEYICILLILFELRRPCNWHLFKIQSTFHVKWCFCFIFLSLLHLITPQHREDVFVTYPSLVLFKTFIKVHHPISQRLKCVWSKASPDGGNHSIEQWPGYVIQFTAHTHFSCKSLKNSTI